MSGESPGEKPVAFQTCQMQFFQEVPHFFPLFIIVLNAELEESKMEVGAWKRGKEGRGVRGGDLI